MVTYGYAYSMLSIRLCELPGLFRESEYFRSFDLRLEEAPSPSRNSAASFHLESDGNPPICEHPIDQTVNVPADCTRIDPILANVRDMEHMLRTMLFWGFDRTPESVWSVWTNICQHYPITQMAKLGKNVPNLEKSAVFRELIAIRELKTMLKIIAKHRYYVGDTQYISIWAMNLVHCSICIIVCAGVRLFDYLATAYTFTITEQIRDIAANPIHHDRYHYSWNQGTIHAYCRGTP